MRVFSRLRLFATPWTVCSPPASTVYGIFQAILKRAAISYSTGSFPTRGSHPRLLHWQAGYGLTKKGGREGAGRGLYFFHVV